MADGAIQADADRVIAEEYEPFKDEVVRTVASKLAASKINFAAIDMDGFYNQAWYGLWTKLQDGQQIENRKGLLVQMTYRRAIDEYRTLHPDRHADPVVLETIGHENPIEETLDQQQEFRHFVEGMRSSLNQRELRAATLCYVYGMSRPEAAEQVGVRPKRMEKIMDEVSKKLRPVLESIKEGNFCADRAVLINQYALGALEPGSEDFEEAVLHLEGCPGCRRHVLGTRGLTAVTIPSVVMLVALTGAASATAAGAATAAAASGSGGASGGGAGAGAAGAGMGTAAQAAAVVAAVAAVAAGGFFAVNQLSGGDDAQLSTPPPPAAAETPKPSAEQPAAKKSTPKQKQSESAPEPAPAPPAAAPAPAPDPAPQPQYTPSNPSTDSGAEFDLQ